MEPEIVETIDTQSAQINLNAIQLAEKLAEQVIAITLKYNALSAQFENKLAEALAEDALEDEIEIAEAVAARLEEVRASIEAEFDRAEAEEEAQEAASVSQILGKLSEAGISL
ncbi:MAG: hypothetical protein DDT31_00210 [Syntrophomonadaceae bacterium]|nr:hypothetical protein [Bacillota bacterium]